MKAKKYKSQIIYLDSDGNPCEKEKAVQARILEEFPDGSRQETWGWINKGKGPIGGQHENP